MTTDEARQPTTGDPTDQRVPRQVLDAVSNRTPDLLPADLQPLHMTLDTWKALCRQRERIEQQIVQAGIAKKYRNKGLGKALQLFALQILKEKQISYVIIEYTSAAGFYRKIGFKPSRSYYMLKKDL